MGRLARGEVELAFADAQLCLVDDASDARARLLRARCLLAFGKKDELRSELSVIEALAPEMEDEVAELRRDVERHP